MATCGVQAIVLELKTENTSNFSPKLLNWPSEPNQSKDISIIATATTIDTTTNTATSTPSAAPAGPAASVTLTVQW